MWMDWWTIWITWGGWMKEIPYEIKLRKAKFLEDEEFLRMHKLDKNDILEIKTTVEKVEDSPVNYLTHKYLNPMEFGISKEKDYKKYSWICPRCAICLKPMKKYRGKPVKGKPHWWDYTYRCECMPKNMVICVG